jgi:hypothetical protein
VPSLARRAAEEDTGRSGSCVVYVENDRRTEIMRGPDEGGLSRSGAGADTTRHPGLQIELMSMQPRAHPLPSGLGKTLIESDGGT